MPPSQPVLATVITQQPHGRPNGHQGLPTQAERVNPCHHGSLHYQETVPLQPGLPFHCQSRHAQIGSLPWNLHQPSQFPTTTPADLSRPTPAEPPDQLRPSQRTSQSTVEAPASLQLSRASKSASSVNSSNTAPPRQPQRTPRSTNPSQQSHPLPPRKPITPVDSLYQ